MEMSYNLKTVKVGITRRELCDLLLACTCLADETEQARWNALHDKLRAQLDSFDEKNGIGCFHR